MVTDHETAGTTAIDTNRLKGLFRDLVNCYSPSGKEHDLVDMLSSYLTAWNLQVLHQPVDTDGRVNLHVTGKGAAPETALIGHLDTVPAFDMEECGFSECEGRVFGLGTADMKGGCAALIEAFTAAASAGNLREDIGLFLVVGEEETGDGMAALLETNRFKHALVAEPTDLLPCLHHSGYIEMLIRTFGTRRHASLAGREYNAIFGMLSALGGLAETIEHAKLDVILNIRDLHSSQSGFAVPDSCEAWIDLHIPAAAEPADAARQIGSLATEWLKKSSVTRYEIEFPTLASGYAVREDAPLAHTLRHVFASLNLPWQPDVFRSHSDANLLHQAGCDAIILGPGQLARAHTCDESVAFSQVVDAARIYEQVCGKGFQT